MPELPEVERYRQLLHEHGLGRRVAAVHAGDAWYLKGGADARRLSDELTGTTIVAVDRRGKLLLATTDSGRVLGLRFGMSGRLLIDGRTAVERLLYSPVATDARYHRFGLDFVDGGDLRIHDPRRLGGVQLDPPVDLLGPDALSLSAAALGKALAGSATPLKARLMDQSKVAGIGNLAADEILWRAGLDPTRRAGQLNDSEVRRLSACVRGTLRMLLRRGGSHTGDLMPARVRGGSCPSDGTPLRRLTVGGRTTYWCPEHQQ